MNIATTILLMMQTALAVPSEPFHDFEQNHHGWNVQHGVIQLSEKHAKSGNRSLEWDWNKGGGILTLELDSEQPCIHRTDKDHFGLWLYNPFPREDRLSVTLYDGDKVLASFWYGLRYSGWRPLGMGFSKLGIPEHARVTKIVFSSPQESGHLWLDAVRPLFTSIPVQADDQQPWADSLGILAESHQKTRFDRHDISVNRPWLPRLINQESIPVQTQQDMARLQAQFIPIRRELPHREQMLDEAITAFQNLGISERNGAIKGPPLECDDTNSVFLPLPNALHFCRDIMPVMQKLTNAALQTQSPKQDTSRRMLILLCRYILDQGFQEGNGNLGWLGNGYDFRHYPPALMRAAPILQEEGLLEEMATSAAFLANGHGLLSKQPQGNCDGFYNFSAHLPGLVLLLNNPAERYQRLRAFKQYLDRTLGNPLPLGEDGTLHHHGGAHPAYASYAFPSLIKEQILPFKGTEFYPFPATHEKLRRHVKTLAAQSVRGQLAPNLHMRSGILMNQDVTAPALLMARMGSPDGREDTDREMAGIYLYHLNGKDTPEAREFHSKGILPVAPEPHLSLNMAAQSIHHGDQWQAAAAGMIRKFRSLEIYGWLESNNYGRFSRNCSLFLTVNGKHGWNRSGWNWNHWPGGTNPVLSESELLEGYTMYANNNDMGGGVTLEKNGIWGNDFDCRETKFKKSIFFFHNRITVLTSDIEIRSMKNRQVITTLFQQEAVPEGTTSTVNGNPSSLIQKNGSAPTLIRDTLNNGYYVYPGTPFTLKKSRQSWTYFFKKDLLQPNDNPCLDMRRKKFRDPELAANAKYYRPSSGDFELAYIDHGTSNSPLLPCAYTILVDSSKEDLEHFSREMQSEHPAIRILQQNASAHILHDRDTNTTGYVIFSPEQPLPGSLVKSNRPGFIMVRQQGNTLTIALSVSDPAHNQPFTLEFADGRTCTMHPRYPLGAVKILK